MIYTPIWKDITFNTGSSPLEYQIVKEREVLHTGYATNFPGSNGVELNLNKTIEEYLKPDFETDINEVDNGIVINFDAYSEFNVVNTSNNNVMETYGVLYDWSYDNGWSGETNHLMSQPINGHIDPRMKLLFTLFNREVDQIDVVITTADTISVSPTVASFVPSGGSQSFVVNATGPFTVVAPDWVTTASTQDGFTATVPINTGTSVRSGNIVVKVDGSSVSASIAVSQEGLPTLKYKVNNGVAVQISDYSGFGATVLSNTVDTATNIGTIVFNGPVTKMVGVFYRQTNLVEVDIPSTVTLLDNYTFGNCRNLVKVNAYPENAPTMTRYPFSNIGSNGEFHYNGSSSYSSWVTLFTNMGWSIIQDL